MKGAAGLSELTICLIVLPVVIVILIAVLFCVAAPKGSRSKIPNSTHCCFRRGRSANGSGEAAALTVSTAASSPSSTMNQVSVSESVIKACNHKWVTRFSGRNFNSHVTCVTRVSCKESTACTC